MSEAEAKKEDELYYILDARSVVGNCCLWWGPDGKGYTDDLGQAGLYSHDEAHSKRESDVPVPRDIAERLASKHVRLDHIREHIKMPGIRGRRRQ